MFDEKNYHKRMPLIFMHGFVKDATKSVVKDGMEHIEYVPTQIVAEYFRHIFRNPDSLSLDGITYRSSVVPQGICFALFCRNEDCTDDSISEGKTLALVGTNKRKVTDMPTDMDLRKEFEKLNLDLFGQ
jgi:hypothetical protein